MPSFREKKKRKLPNQNILLTATRPSVITCNTANYAVVHMYVIFICTLNFMTRKFGEFKLLISHNYASLVIRHKHQKKTQKSVGPMAGPYSKLIRVNIWMEVVMLYPCHICLIRMQDKVHRNTLSVFFNDSKDQP